MVVAVIVIVIVVWTIQLTFSLSLPTHRWSKAKLD